MADMRVGAVNNVLGEDGSPRCFNFVRLVWAIVGVDGLDGSVICNVQVLRILREKK